MLKTLRILSWIKRFLSNCKKQQVRSPLTSSKTEYRREFLIKEEQHRYSKCEKFELSKQQLNLKLRKVYRSVTVVSKESIQFSHQENRN